MKKTLKTAIFAFAVVAAGFGGIKTYQSMFTSHENLLMQNVEALSGSGEPGQTINITMIELVSIKDKSGPCCRYGIDNTPPIPIYDKDGHITGYKYHYSWQKKGGWKTCTTRVKNDFELNDPLFDLRPQCKVVKCTSGYDPYDVKPTSGVGFYASDKNPHL